MCKNRIMLNLCFTALALFCCAAALADSFTLSGEGTPDAPYLINDAGDWWTFAEYIIEGRDASAVYKLNADLSDISMTIGSEDYPFRGVFNGDGHTLAVDIEETANRDGSAPFRAVCGATIQNLTVTGNVSGHTNTGGLVGLALGNADDDTETNTISNVTIKASIDGYSCGGIVAHAKNSKLILSDCQVEGTLSCSLYYAGGFQGWSDGNTITITNCLFNGTYTGSGAFHPIAVHGEGSNTKATVDGAYYSFAPQKIAEGNIAVEGTRVFDTVPEDELVTTVTLFGKEYYRAVKTTVGQLDHFYDYTGDSITIDYTVAFDGRDVTGGPEYTTEVIKDGLPVSQIVSNGNYTLVIRGNNEQRYFGSSFAEFKVYGLSTDENGRFLLENAEDWEYFAWKVKTGDDFSGKTLMMTADIGTVSDAIGTEEHPFAGVFDGDGKKLTVKIESDGYGAAPFGFVSGATICNLNVAGEVTGGNDPSGLVSVMLGGTNVIDRCLVSTQILHGEGSPSGIVGNPRNSTVIITNCISNVTMPFYRSKVGWSNSKCGMVGYCVGGSLTLENCLFCGKCYDYCYGTTRPIGYYENGSGTVITLSNVYSTETRRGDSYKSDIGSPKLAFDSIPESMIVKPVNILEMDFYGQVEVGVDGLHSIYNYDNEEPIDLEYSVTFDGEFANEGFDYNVILRLNEEIVDAPTSRGNYTLSINGIAENGYLSSNTYSFQVSGLAYDENGCYPINSTEDWEALAYNISKGFSYTGKTFKMTADIGPVSSPIGTEEHPFDAIFEGNGKTLSVNIVRYNETTGKGTAPFRYISGGATIRNLTVEGTVNGFVHSAGLVGYSTGGSEDKPNIIENCLVRTQVDVTQPNRYVHIGGVVGHGTTSWLTIQNTAFMGTMINYESKWKPYGTSSTVVLEGFAGGLQGWSDGNHLTIENCLFGGSYSGAFPFHPIAVHNAGVTDSVNVNDAYYSQGPQNIGEDNIAADGRQVSVTMPVNRMYKSWSICGVPCYTEVAVSSTDFYPYTGGEIELQYTVTDADGVSMAKDRDYITYLAREGTGIETAREQGHYTLALTGKGAYEGVQVIDFSVDSRIPVTADTAEMTGSNTYIVYTDTDNQNRIEVSGEATLFLKEGCTLTAPNGIHVSEGNQLTIDGNGTLVIRKDNFYNAGIGGNGTNDNFLENSGTIIINGGTIDVNGGRFAAAIGGGIYGNTGTIIINDGVIVARGGICSPAIGSGDANWYSGGSITINGGQITAIGGSYDDEIYAIGDDSSSTTIPITLGWTQTTDFISLEGECHGNVQFIEGKSFVDENGSVVTSGSDIRNTKIVPDLNAEQNKYFIECASLSGVQEQYPITGSVIQPVPTVTTSEGIVLVKGEDYTLSYSGDGKTEGYYSLTVNGMGLYTGSQTFRYMVTASGLLVDTDFNPDVLSFHYTTIPTEGNRQVELDGSVTRFKVYDNGGKNADYDDECRGTLTLIAPENYALRLSGNVTTECQQDTLMCSEEILDYDNLFIASSETEGVTRDIGVYTSPGRKMSLVFYTNESVHYSGLDLTVTVVPQYDVRIDENITHGTVTADRAAAAEGEIVKLICVPENEGFALGKLSIRQGGEETNLTENFFTMPAGNVTVTAGFFTGIPYLDSDQIKTAGCRTVSEDSVTWDGGWWAVTDSVRIGSRVTVRGSVNLILADDRELTAVKGINVAEGNSLTVWMQEEGTGVLTITGPDAGCAGIGGSNGQRSGSVSVQGGTLNIQAGSSAPGIGGGSNGSDGAISIANGLMVTVAGADTAVLSEERNGACGSGRLVIAPCVHAGPVTINRFGKAICGHCSAMMPESAYGTGHADDPWKIDSAQKWDALASAVENGLHTAGRYFVLADDITVSTMIGMTEQKPFNGFFDGAGNTLTFNYATDSDVCGPFRYVGAASFENLSIKGTVTTSKENASGLVGKVIRTCRITNCISDIDIVSTGNGGTHAGFVALSSHVAVKGCAFTGSITGAKARYCAGFLGWDTGNASTVVNCMYDGLMTAGANASTFVRTTNAGKNSYYTNINGLDRYEKKGKLALSVTADAGTTLDFGEGTVYNVSGITAYDTGMVYDDVFYAGKEETVSLKGVLSGNPQVRFTASNGTLTKMDDIWKLTMAEDNVRIRAVIVRPFEDPDFALPAFLTKVGDGAFMGIAACIVDVPDTCSAIGDYAFKDSPNLTQIRIPANCKIGTGAFENCEMVMIFCAPGSPAQEYCDSHANCVLVED